MSLRHREWIELVAMATVANSASRIPSPAAEMPPGEVITPTTRKEMVVASKPGPTPPYQALAITAAKKIGAGGDCTNS